jgi:hypothetical protein
MLRTPISRVVERKPATEVIKVKLSCVVLMLLCWPALAQPVTAPEAFFNLPFAQDGERELLLDVYLPEPGKLRHHGWSGYTVPLPGCH